MALIRGYLKTCSAEGDIQMSELCVHRPAAGGLEEAKDVG